MKRTPLLLLSLTLAACGGEDVADPVEQPGGEAAVPGASNEIGGKGDGVNDWRDPAEYIGKSWGNGVTGLLQFRGNPTHTYYGEGPVPSAPEVEWRYPSEAMCGTSRVGGRDKTWCGTGWTGQPVVWERPDGVTEIIFGAYDKSVHFVDADTGLATRPKFKTGDIIKGSVSLDPDGFPLLYFGSRDNKLRVVALDRDEPTELWHLDAYSVSPIMWNNDWDGNPSIVGDVLFEGGENSWFFAYKLNRAIGEDGKVTVNPEPLIAQKGWTSQLIDDIGDNTVSIESSAAIFNNRVYFANSGGRVMGLDISALKEGEALPDLKAPIAFDFWAGDDVDASIVIDEEGMLYVSVEKERFLDRADEVGQIIKLNPYAEGDPIVWSVHLPTSSDGTGGVWATPALGEGVLYVPTHDGQLLALDQMTGDTLWKDTVGWHAWSSPAVVDGRLVVGTCNGKLRIYDVFDPTTPSLIGEGKVPSGACVESTPAIWKGRIVVGTRDGYFYSFSDTPEEE
ncbi:MAG: PQQ-binding-like beta-propeller repeat protein [Bradymonadia bacterium]